MWSWVLYKTFFTEHVKQLLLPLCWGARVQSSSIISCKAASIINMLGGERVGCGGFFNRTSSFSPFYLFSLQPRLFTYILSDTFAFFKCTVPSFTHLNFVQSDSGRPSFCCVVYRKNKQCRPDLISKGHQHLWRPQDIVLAAQACRSMN